MSQEPVSVPVDVLREHWLRVMECDGDLGRNKPHCSCSRVDLGWHPTQPAAAEAWIAHVVASSVAERPWPFTGCSGPLCVSDDDEHDAPDAPDHICPECSGNLTDEEGTPCSTCRGGPDNWKAADGVTPSPTPAPKAELVCKKCGVDRFKQDCPGPRADCPMVATALGVIGSGDPSYSSDTKEPT